MAATQINNGQQGSEVRAILNNALVELTEVSQTVEDTIPLTNMEIDIILRQYEDVIKLNI